MTQQPPFPEDEAIAIIKREGLSLQTLATWRLRGSIPARYSAPAKRVKLGDVDNAALKRAIEIAVNKHGAPLLELLARRTFQADRELAYYRQQLMSLCAEIKRTANKPATVRPVSQRKAMKAQKEIEKLQKDEAALAEKIKSVKRKIAARRVNISTLEK